MFISSGFRHTIAIGVAIVALVVCSCSGSSITGSSAANTRTASTISGTVALTAPSNYSIKTGPFTASVALSDMQGDYAAPYVEYWLSGSGGYNQCLGTGWTAPSFAKTLTPPSGKFGYYTLTAKLYAYDNDGPPYGPFQLDTDYIYIIVDTD
jgi:hypothetical protein